MLKKIFCLLLAAVLTILFVPEIRAEEKPDSFFEGKTVSILGDSISTYAGISNNADYNSTIGKNAVFYSVGALGGFEQTWWQQTIDALGMELLVNNSWSGSTVLHPHSGTAGAYVDRCVQLHNDHTGEKPDVIVVFMGTNDFTFYEKSLGNADIDYDDLLKNRLDAPKTTCEAYAIMLHKMKNRYPDAEIYCMNLFLRRIPQISNHNPVSGQPTLFNDEIDKVIRRFGCKLVDLEELVAPEAEIFDRYFSDNVHPNVSGMDLITEALISAMLGKKVTVYNVSYNLENTSVNISAASVLCGKEFSADISANKDCENLSVTVKMGGKDVTTEVYKNGKIAIPAVFGDIEIFAKANVTLNKHLQPLPAKLCAGTNLWTSLTPEHLFYTGTEWGLVSSVPDAHSITFTVQPGERIFVSSLGKAGENGFNANGVRITWFRGEDVLSSKTLYIEDRIITVPENATAVNVPMYTGENKWEVYLLDREHVFENNICFICGTWEYSLADINLDGAVNVEDAYYARLVAAKLIKPTAEQLAVGDVDLDGKITAIDANIIRKYSVGIIKSLPVQ